MKKLPVVAHVFLLHSGSVLLVRRSNTGFKDGSYGPVGGHLESGETIQQAAIRECHEEIGVIIKSEDLKIIGVTHYNSSAGAGQGIDFFLIAKKWEGEPFLKAECDDMQWCPIDDLPQKIMPFVKRAIEHHLLKGVWFDEIGWEEDTLEYI